MVIISDDKKEIGLSSFYIVLNSLQMTHCLSTGPSISSMEHHWPALQNLELIEQIERENNSGNKNNNI